MILNYNDLFDTLNKFVQQSFLTSPYTIHFLAYFKHKEKAV